MDDRLVMAFNNIFQIIIFNLYNVPELNNTRIAVIPYFGELEKAIIDDFDCHLRNYNLKCNISKVFDINDFNHSYNRLEAHYIGKLVFRI